MNNILIRRWHTYVTKRITDYLYLIILFIKWLVKIFILQRFFLFVFITFFIIYFVVLYRIIQFCIPEPKEYFPKIEISVGTFCSYYDDFNRNNVQRECLLLMKKIHIVFVRITYIFYFT
jgi:hypothetical protein